MITKRKNIYISSFLVIVFVAVQFILPIQIAKAATPDPMKECGIKALTDFVTGGVANLISEGLKTLGKAAEAIPGVGGIISSALGGKTQDVSDKDVKTNTTILSVKGCIQALTDAAFKVALAKMKKRLLDRITDDTVQWINNGAKGKPRFIDNFDDVLKESANEALGDTARELGLGKLCDEQLSLKLQLNLQKPATKKFRQEASCTLDKIVKNIDAFSKDFRNGGFIGYTETMSPNNNRFGIEILALDNVILRQTQEDQKSQMLASSGGGFKAVEACSNWEIVFEEGRDTFSKIRSVYDFNGPEFDLVRDPNAEFTQTQLNSLFGSMAPTAVPVVANCNRKEITMPSQLVKGQAEQALQSDKDVITNADDLSPYISAIFDAAINRLVKSGLEGIGIGKSKSNNSGSSILTESGKGRENPEPLNDQNDPNGTYRKYGGQYQNTTDMKEAIRTSIKANIAEIKTQVATLDLMLPVYIVGFNERESRMEGLLQCEKQKSSNVISTNTNIHLPCETTATTLDALTNLHNSAIEFQKLVASVKKGLETEEQDISSLGQNELIALASQISASLDTIKANRAELETAVAKLKELDTKIDEHKSACINATPIYTCPATF